MVGQFTEVERLEEEHVWGGEREFCSEIQIKHSDDVVKKAIWIHKSGLHWVESVCVAFAAIWIKDVIQAETVDRLERIAWQPSPCLGTPKFKSWAEEEDLTEETKKEHPVGKDNQKNVMIQTLRKEGILRIRE